MVQWDYSGDIAQVISDRKLTVENAAKRMIEMSWYAIYDSHTAECITTGHTLYCQAFKRKLPHTKPSTTKRSSSTELLSKPNNE